MEAHSDISPLDALRQMEEARANDPQYKAHRAYWRKEHEKDARRNLPIYFCVGMLPFLIVAALWGKPLASAFRALSGTHASGWLLLGWIAGLVAFFAWLVTRNTYR